MNLVDLGRGDKHGMVSVLMSSVLMSSVLAAVEGLASYMSAAVCYAVVGVLFSVT